MASEVIGGATQGASAGATVGTAIVPGVGTVVGAVIGGVVGAIGGFFSNKKKKQAKRAAREAANITRRQQAAQLGLQRRDIFRQARIARANAINAGAGDSRTISSSPQGAAASVGAQLDSAIRYFDDQVILDYQANEFRKKAGKYAGQAADINSALGSLGSIGNIGANIIGTFKTPTGTASTTPVGGTPPFVGPR